MGLTQKLGTIPLAILTDASNNVGIGAAPSGTYKLEVTGTGRFTSSLTASDFSFTGTGAVLKASASVGTAAQYGYFSNTGGIFYFGKDDSTASTFGLDAYTTVLWNSGNYPIVIATNNAERFRVTGAGNVGIGTSSPTDKLHIVGDAFAGIRINDGTNTAVLQFHSSDGFRIVTATAKPLVFFTNDTDRMRITSGGDVLIGATSIFNDGKLCVSADATRVTIASKVSVTSGAEHIRFINPNGVVGYISTSGTSTSYSTSSDYRLKQDLKDYNGLNLISAIKTYDYEWKSNKTRSYGVLAHELAEVFPDAVMGIKDDINKDETIKPQGVDYSKLVPILIKGMQEQQALIEDLKSRLDKAGL